MKSDSTSRDSNQPAMLLVDDWFDPIEASLRAGAREFIETLLEEELSTALSRPLSARGAGNGGWPDLAGVVGHRHGQRPRTLSGTFGRVEFSVPRARLVNAAGETIVWRMYRTRFP